MKLRKLKKRNLLSLLAIIQELSFLENGIFDVQIKCIHEYKRQQMMNALYIIRKYLEIKSGLYPKSKRPISFIFGGKAAPAYI